MENPMVDTASRANTEIKEGGSRFQMEYGVIFAITSEGFRTLLTNEDIYEGLYAVQGMTLLPDELGIGLVSTGWASPIPPDFDGDEDEITAPSQHPEKRRVRLVTCVDKSLRMGSALCFQDDPDEIITDEGQATGNLAIAVRNSLIAMLAKAE
jgi:hypothetical protein